MVRIATDGSGKTFLISNDYGRFYIMQGNMKFSEDLEIWTEGGKKEADKLK